MARVRRNEIVEIPVEQLSYAPGRHRDRTVGAGVWSQVRRAASMSPPLRPQQPSVERLWAASVRGVFGRGDPGPAFWRVIDVRGNRLEGVVIGWWEHEEHDDGHLRLDSPRPVGEAWLLTGSFRVTTMSRWLPVDLLLSPRIGPWTLLELIPRRSVHTSSTYFRVGHRCLDRFVDTLRTYDVGADHAGRGAAPRGQ
jgi:hypothetical protein